jgi:CelD/BcsL family acetyltransferase involved in cellulose biosynthesis
MNSLAFLPAEGTERPVTPRGAAQACLPQPERLFTEIVNLDDLTRFRPAWTDLAARALEPNVFLEPGFAIPLFQHCGSKGKLGFLLVWAETEMDSRHKLLGLLPLSLPTGLLSLFARVESHEHAPLGTPLFDRDQGPDALRHMIAWLRRHHPRLSGLMLPHLPKQGPAVAMLSLYAEANQDRLHLFNEYERAALSGAVGAAGRTPNFISTKRRKHYRQQRRRLAESGDVAYRTIRDPAEIRQATEAFLSLEFQGWKGARKTALLSAASGATFFRSMTRVMALEGKCRIDSLDIDGSPVALGVVLQSGDTAFYWKTTYDERFAALSPGVQLTLELTETQLASPSVALTDSCAIANHPMIDHIWRDRIAMADVLLPLHHAKGFSFSAGLWLEIVQQYLHCTVKPLLKRLLRRRH